MRALMVRSSILVFAFTLVQAAGIAQPVALRSNEQVLHRAEHAFRQGLELDGKPLQAMKHFSEATRLYHELHHRGVRTPALYFNLGNAAVLADRWPEALWAYQLGLKLDPNQQQMREHRDFVRTKVIYPSSGQGRPESESWPAWLYRPSLYVLSVVAGVAYVLAWFAGLAALIRRSSRLLLVATLAMLLGAGAGLLLWHGMEQAKDDHDQPLVIVIEKTHFYRGNGINYPQHPELPLLFRGMEARRLHQRGGWLQVRLSTGETGWVPLSNVLVVEP